MATEKELERKIRKIYSEAQKDIQKKWDEYFERAEKRLADKEERLKITRDPEDSAKLKAEIEQDKMNMTLRNEYYRDMVNETTKQIANANQTAVAYANGQMPSFYTQTYNTEMKAEAVDLGFHFDMADEATVKRLITDGDIDLPPKKVNIPKDQRWNTKQINSQVTQGIIQGESMDKIAKRLMPIVDNNRNAAIRNARTLVNGAENRGRQDRYRELEKQGAVMKRIWIATGDERTRDWHLDMDGQEVDLDEPFIDGNGNELDYPGDPHAAPETVYNCRCTTKSRLIGFRRADGTIVRVDYDPTTQLHKEQIQAEIKRRQEEEKAAEKDKANKKG